MTVLSSSSLKRESYVVKYCSIYSVHYVLYTATYCVCVFTFSPVLSAALTSAVGPQSSVSLSHQTTPSPSPAEQQYYQHSLIHNTHTQSENILYFDGQFKLSLLLSQRLECVLLRSQSCYIHNKHYSYVNKNNKQVAPFSSLFVSSLAA